jgi:hypothetical protein
MSPSSRRLAALLTALLAASAASADDLSDVRLKDLAPDQTAAPQSRAAMNANPSCAARGFEVGGRCGAASKTRLCRGVAECEKYCCCAFDFDVSKWTGVYDWKTTNVLAPTDIDGALRPDSPELVDLGQELQGMEVLVDYRGKIATKTVAAGLRRLDAVLAALPERRTAPFTVDVNNCYRRAIGNEIEPLSPLGPDANAEAVCGELFVMMRLEDKPARGANEQTLLDGLHSTQDSAFLMAWPGWTPHAAGDACDLIVRDAKGAPCFGASAGAADSPKCSIDQRHAVDMLDEAAGQAGGWRLDYEAWHFEWGGKTGPGSCRCRGEGCGGIWPVTQAAGCPD